MNRAGKIALGCLLAPIGLMVLGVFFFMAIRMAGVPDPQVTTKSLKQEISERARLESTRVDPDPFDQTTPAAGELRLAKDQVVQVLIDLEEGYFDLYPGPAEEGFQVKADYDEATYDLIQEYETGKDGAPMYRLIFKSKVSFLRRIAQDGKFDDSDLEDNSISVQIPVDTPMNLVLKLAKAEAEVDLSGLAIQNASTQCRMGEFRFQTTEANPLTMESFSSQCSMGEFTFRGMSLLRSKHIRAEGSMGETRFDLGGALEVDTEIVTRQRMGSMLLSLPENAFWDPSSRTKASWGEVQGSLDKGSGDPETAPKLRLDGSVFMGELVVDSYRPRRLRSRDRP